MFNQRIENIIKEYLAELSEKGLVVSQAILYGSYAKGTATSESDIDLLLVSPQFDIDEDKYVPKVWISKIRNENHIEPFMVGEKRFAEDNVSTILEAARTEGIQITL